MTKITKYVSNLGRILLAGAVLGTQTSFNNDLSGFEPIFPDFVKESTCKKERPIYEQIEEDKSIDLNVLFSDSIKTLNNYEQTFSNPYDSIISEIYLRCRNDSSVIDENFIKANIHEESSFNKKNISWVGARGLLQVMKKTWYDNLRLNFEKYSLIPEYNLNVGIRHMFFIENCLKNNFVPWNNLSNKEKLVAISEAYNGGQGLLAKVGLENMPKQSKEHGKKVLDRYLQYEKTEMNKKYSEYVQNYFRKNNPSWDSLSEKEKSKEINEFYSVHSFKINFGKQFFSAINLKDLKNY
jgi:hypothetical protein